MLLNLVSELVTYQVPVMVAGIDSGPRTGREARSTGGGAPGLGTRL